MKFSTILGGCNSLIVKECENKLSSVFLELTTSYDNQSFGTKLGGDIFLHQLVSPLEHVCDARSPVDSSNAVATVATDGQSFWWSPSFILGKSLLGLRLAVFHDGIHLLYMHPARRGCRNPRAWNIAVDFKANFACIDDLRARKAFNPEEVFTQELGKFITLREYLEFLANPFNPPSRLHSWNPFAIQKSITNNQKYSIEDFAFAEPNLPEELNTPENIYDLAMRTVPKCYNCGKLGVYNKPAEYLELEKKFILEKEPVKGTCIICNDEKFYHFNPFELGRLTDQHLDLTVEYSTLLQHVQNAHSTANKLGSQVSKQLESDLKLIGQPTINWQDFIRSTKRAKVAGYSQNNWFSPKRKLLFGGLFVPQKISYKTKFLFAYDCSGSFNHRQIGRTLCELQTLSDSCEGWCLPWDTRPFFESMIEIKSCKVEQLKNAKYKGGGGTILSPLFREYSAKVGKIDLLIIASDFYLADLKEVSKLQAPPGVEVIWLSVDGNPRFEPPFGKLFKLLLP